MTILLRNPKGEIFIISSEMNLKANLMSFRTMYKNSIPHIDAVTNFIHWHMTEIPSTSNNVFREFNLLDTMSNKLWTFRVSEQPLTKLVI
jgi:hypothetical protein